MTATKKIKSPRNSPPPVVTARQAAPPAIGYSLLEVPRIFLELGSSLALAPLLTRLPGGDGHTVMTLPPFLGADGCMALLRRYLDKLGYRAISWGLGRNMPRRISSMEQLMAFRRETEAAIAEILADEVERSGHTVSLVGWSLGGLHAAGLAHRHPDLVRQAITLGTPFGDFRGTAFYPLMRRIQKVPVSEEAIHEWKAHAFTGELKAPISALYSLSDGVVNTDIACLPEHELTENIAVLTSHVGFPFNPLVRALLAERLAQAPGHWRPCSMKDIRPLMQRLVRHPA